MEANVNKVLTRDGNGRASKSEQCVSRQVGLERERHLLSLLANGRKVDVQLLPLPFLAARLEEGRGFG